ncbi:MAG: hypothetical protein A2W72_18130 [Burkholderiales bacterium RIFCSPLOWO2_12_67_14]|nr:MAG: hypothetical protein A3I64_09495 [Burkholderiales bacterium RIFCSPLOWO2_02_FULL_67_64]OGB39108.1 MAG: hypothetical protein A2W72_18130 [Burkholderiales bacterium RIFCSPLOWO2_12_67_14]
MFTFGTEFEKPLGVTSGFLVSHLDEIGKTSLRLGWEKKWDFQQRRRKAVVVVPFIKAALICRKQLRQDRWTDQLDKWPGSGLAHKETVMLKQCQKPGYIFYFSFGMKS